MRSHSISAVFLFVLTVRLFGQSSPTDRFVDVARQHVRAEYGANADHATPVRTGLQDGLIISIKLPRSSVIAKYWIFIKEVTPVYAGIAAPEKKWKRICCLGISGPRYGGSGYMWRRALTDHEYDALRQIDSPIDVGVESEVIKNVIRDKILPERDSEWHNGALFVRSTKAFFYEFTFRSPLTDGGNLVFVTLYLDRDGSVIAKREAMMHID